MYRGSELNAIAEAEASKGRLGTEGRSEQAIAQIRWVLVHLSEALSNNAHLLERVRDNQFKTGFKIEYYDGANQ